MSGTDARPPVHVLTGALGSGKTTLLRHLLADPAYAGTAVLINEVGEVGLDHRLVGAVMEAPVLLASGCICCAIRGDLAAALRDLLGRQRAGALAFERVVIETSGLADPTPVVATLLGDLGVRRGLRPGLVLTTVDAVHAPARLDTDALLRKQAAAADRLLLTKSDLAGEPTAAALAHRLQALNPAARVLACRHGRVEHGLLDGTPLDRVIATEHGAAPHQATSFTLVLDGPLDYAAFALWLSLLVHRHGARLLRVKAILDVAGHDRPVALHAIQHLIHPPEHLPAWEDAERRSVLVFVTDGLDRATVARSLAAFLRGSQGRQ